MFEPSEFWNHAITLPDNTDEAFTLTGWFNTVYRVTGGPYDNAWYLGRSGAAEEFFRRTAELREAYNE